MLPRTPPPWTTENQRQLTGAEIRRAERIGINALEENPHGQTLKRLILPSEGARLVLFLASDAGCGITSQSYIVDGGWL
jgi:NAD(P)-dependent dehydrogenase (short-subunit alcohol dehydrogenase family)